jgi:hypothetical protein
VKVIKEQEQEQEQERGKMNDDDKVNSGDKSNDKRKCKYERIGKDNSKNRREGRGTGDMT